MGWQQKREWEDQRGCGNTADANAKHEGREGWKGISGGDRQTSRRGQKATGDKTRNTRVKPWQCRRTGPNNWNNSLMGDNGERETHTCYKSHSVLSPHMQDTLCSSTALLNSRQSDSRLCFVCPAFPYWPMCLVITFTHVCVRQRPAWPPLPFFGSGLWRNAALFVCQRRWYVCCACWCLLVCTGVLAGWSVGMRRGISVVFLMFVIKYYHKRPGSNPRHAPSAPLRSSRPPPQITMKPKRLANCWK